MSQIQGKYDKLMKENEQNKKNINDLDFDAIINMISSREDAFFYARFYESTCRQIVCPSRNAIRSIDYIINDSTLVYKKQIEFLIQNKKLLCTKIEKFCNELIDLIDKQIFPAVRDNESIILEIYMRIKS